MHTVFAGISSLHARRLEDAHEPLAEDAVRRCNGKRAALYIYVALHAHIVNERARGSAAATAHSAKQSAM